MTKTAPSLSVYKKRSSTLRRLSYAIAIVAFIFASFHDSISSGFVLYFTLSTLAFFVGGMLILAPLRIKARQWSAWNPDYQPVDLESPNLPSALKETVTTAAGELKSIGFVLRGLYKQHNQVLGKIDGFVALFEHPKAHDTATFHFVSSPAVISSFVAFLTKYEDGSIFWTTNLKMAIPQPGDHSCEASMSYPQVENTARLYEIHQARMNYGASRSPIEGDPRDYLVKSTRKTMTRWIEQGYYYLDEKADVLRLTFKGAYIMTWLSIWPVPPIRRWMKRHRAAKVLRDLGMEGA